ncbi:hypothetical protein HK101_006014 [Irineochytrium annulatum]|nr:hypothetical protein HK101_006014 [Irineochytrium annulatum]
MTLIPFFALIFGYITASVVVVGVIGWKFTYDSGSNSVNDLANKIQAQISSQVLASVQTSASVITQVTLYQREMWETGKWSMEPATRNATMAGMLSVLKYEWQTYYNGTKDFLIWNGTSIGYNVTDPGFNGTLEYSKSSWGINFTDPSFTIMGPVYTWNAAAYKTSISIVQNPITQERALVGNDWTLDFLSEQFQGLLDAVPYPMFFTAIESNTAQIVATSIDLQLAIPSTGLILTYDAAIQNSTFFNDFYSWASSTYKSPQTSDQLLAMTAAIQATGPILLRRNIAGVNYLARYELMSVPWDKPWVSVQYLDVDKVTEALRNTSFSTEIIIFSIMAFMVVVGTLFAWMMSSQIVIVVNQIEALKDLKFQDVLNKEGIRRPSFVAELGRLQSSFYEMVTVFANHLKVKNDMSKSGMSTTGIRSDKSQNGFASDMAPTSAVVRVYSVSSAK